MKLHGFCSLNRFGVNVPYDKHDTAWFFALSSILYNSVVCLIQNR